MFHCHGEADQGMTIGRGRKTSETLKDLVQDYQFHTIPYMGHEANLEAMELIKNFVSEKLPPL